MDSKGRPYGDEWTAWRRGLRHGDIVGLYDVLSGRLITTHKARITPTGRVTLEGYGGSTDWGRRMIVDRAGAGQRYIFKVGEP